MSGLEWTSYVPNPNTYSDNYRYNMGGLYNNIITFFNSNPTVINSGSLTQLQFSSPDNIRNPAITTFTLNNSTSHVSIKFSGFFTANQTGDWTFVLGCNGRPCDDDAILFVGLPGGTIVPATTYTGEASAPSNTNPIAYNAYFSNSYSKTIHLDAGNVYPILILYSQGMGGYVLGFSAVNPQGQTITDFTNYVSPIATNAPCFKKGSKILTDKGYQLIEDLKPGDLLKTLHDGFVPIHMIGHKEFVHEVSDHGIKHQLYVCTSQYYPEVFEDLVLTGCHSILVDDFLDEEQKEKTKEINNGYTYVTDKKYRLPACVDSRTKVYDEPGKYTVYHIALENEDYYMNYGIFANGLLVESCSKRYLKELSNMTLIE